MYKDIGIHKILPIPIPMLSMMLFMPLTFRTFPVVVRVGPEFQSQGTQLVNKFHVHLINQCVHYAPYMCVCVKSWTVHSHSSVLKILKEALCIIYSMLFIHFLIAEQATCKSQKHVSEGLLLHAAHEHCQKPPQRSLTLVCLQYFSLPVDYSEILLSILPFLFLEFWIRALPINQRCRVCQQVGLE